MSGTGSKRARRYAARTGTVGRFSSASALLARDQRPMAGARLVADSLARTDQETADRLSPSRQPNLWETSSERSVPTRRASRIGRLARVPSSAETRARPRFPRGIDVPPAVPGFGARLDDWRRQVRWWCRGRGVYGSVICSIMLRANRSRLLPLPAVRTERRERSGLTRPQPPRYIHPATSVVQ